MLTPQMAKTLQFIRDYIEVHGYAPSYTEIMTHLGLKSKARIHYLIKNLEKRGVIRRLPHYSRAIEVVTNPHLPQHLSFEELRAEAARHGMALIDKDLKVVTLGENQ